jgi:hypothetical protein
MSAIRHTISAAVTGALNGRTTHIDGTVMQPGVAEHAARAYMREWSIPEHEVAVERDADGVSIKPGGLRSPTTIDA